MAENILVDVTNKPKKRPINGRKTDQAKRIRLSNHVTGPECQCKRLNCFDNVNEPARARVIAHLNSIGSRTEQDCFLSGLIEILNVKQRRSRNDENQHPMHNFSYKYFVNVLKDGVLRKTEVCIRAFCSIFGVTPRRLRFIRESLATTGTLISFSLKN